jgi:hypothetical protein
VALLMLVLPWRFLNGLDLRDWYWRGPVCPQDENQDIAFPETWEGRDCGLMLIPSPAILQVSV